MTARFEALFIVLGDKFGFCTTFRHELAVGPRRQTLEALAAQQHRDVFVIAEIYTAVTNRAGPMVYRFLPASQARIACGVVLRAANQNRSIASGNRTIKISPQTEI